MECVRRRCRSTAATAAGWLATQWHCSSSWSAGHTSNGDDGISISGGWIGGSGQPLCLLQFGCQPTAFWRPRSLARLPDCQLPAGTSGVQQRTQRSCMYGSDSWGDHARDATNPHRHPHRHSLPPPPLSLAATSVTRTQPHSRNTGAAGARTHVTRHPPTHSEGSVLETAPPVAAVTSIAAVVPPRPPSGSGKWAFLQPRLLRHRPHRSTEHTQGCTHTAVTAATPTHHRDTAAYRRCCTTTHAWPTNLFSRRATLLVSPPARHAHTHACTANPATSATAPPRWRRRGCTTLASAAAAAAAAVAVQVQPSLRCLAAGGTTCPLDSWLAAGCWLLAGC